MTQNLTPSDVLRCCDDESENGTDGRPFDCVAEWDSQAKTITREYNLQVAVYDNKNAIYQNTLEWERQLKLYWDAIQETHKLARLVESELMAFTIRTQQTCANADWLTSATKHLMGSLWETYYHTRQLQSKITGLINAIKCASDASLQTGDIWKCLNDLSTNLATTMTALMSAIEKMLLVLRTVMELQSSICLNAYDPDWPSHGHDDRYENGLLGLLDELSKYFTSDRRDDSDRLSCEPCNQPNYCTVVLPLSDDEYYGTTWQQYEYAHGQLDRLKDELDTAQKERDRLLAEKTSLENAVTAARDARKNS